MSGDWEGCFALGVELKGKRVCREWGRCFASEWAEQRERVGAWSFALPGGRAEGRARAELTYWYCFRVGGEAYADLERCFLPGGGGERRACEGLQLCSASRWGRMESVWGLGSVSLPRSGPKGERVGNLKRCFFPGG